MEIREMDLEQVETRLNEVKDLLNVDGSDLNALEAEIRALKDRKAEIKAEIEERKKEVEEVIDKGVEVRTFKETERKTNMEIRNSQEYINAYAEYIKTGDDRACRALLTENAAAGTVPVPELVENRVRTAWEREQIMALVRKSYLKGNLKVGFEISSDGAVIHTEGGDAIDPENLVLGVVNLVPQSIKKVIQISDEVYDMRGEEFLNYIYDELTYQIAKKAADTLIGKIVDSPATSTANAPAVPKVVAATIGLDTIAQAIAQLSDEAQNPVIVMNKATWASFKAVQYAAQYAVDPFEGLTVIFNNSLKSFAEASGATQPYAIVGDFEMGALANFPAGDDIQFKFDENTLKKQDLIEILGREYVALGVVAPKAFVKIAKA